ncbi:MAG: prepilin peptidase [Actinomycetes bacterium]
MLWFTIELIGAAVFALILSVHDIRSLRLPNRITLVFFAWELLWVTLSIGKPRFNAISLMEVILLALTWGVLAVFLGMGGGDFKLLFPLALLLRTPSAMLVSLTLAALSGGLFAALRRISLSSHLPFAPFLTLSALITAISSG